METSQLNKVLSMLLKLQEGWSILLGVTLLGLAFELFWLRFVFVCRFDNDVTDPEEEGNFYLNFSTADGEVLSDVFYAIEHTEGALNSGLR